MEQSLVKDMAKGRRGEHVLDSEASSPQVSSALDAEDAQINQSDLLAWQVARQQVLGLSCCGAAVVRKVGVIHSFVLEGR